MTALSELGRETGTDLLGRVIAAFLDKFVLEEELEETAIEKAAAS